jgi:hypothetical protein
LRLYEWTFYNPEGRPKISISRVEQPADETAAAVKAARTGKKESNK